MIEEVWRYGPFVVLGAWWAYLMLAVRFGWPLPPLRRWVRRTFKQGR